MTDKEYEKMRIKLSAYRDTVRCLARRNEEAQRWDSMTSQTTGGILGHRTGGNMGNIVTTTLSLLDECEEICALATIQRAHLCSCIDLVQPQNYRDILESVYLNGKTIEQVATSRAVTNRTIWRWLRCATAKLDECSDYFK